MGYPTHDRRGTYLCLISGMCRLELLRWRAYTDICSSPRVMPLCGPGRFVIEDKRSKRRSICLGCLRKKNVVLFMLLQRINSNPSSQFLLASHSDSSEKYFFFVWGFKRPSESYNSLCYSLSPTKFFPYFSLRRLFFF